MLLKNFQLVSHTPDSFYEGTEKVDNTAYI